MRRISFSLLVFIIFAIISVSSCKAKCPKDILTSIKVEETLGDSVSSILMKARCVTAELQGASQTDSAATNVILTSKQRYVIRFMITNEKNFESNITVFGKLMPNVVYTFTRKKRKVLVAVDFGLRKWQIQNGVGKPLLQFDLKDEGLLYLTHLVFPKSEMINYYYDNKKK